MSLRFSSLALGLAVIGSPGWADVTAAEVWASWQSSLAAGGDGVELTTQAVREDGDNLIVEGAELTFTPELEEEDGEVRFTISIGDILFDGRPDGTVAVTMEDMIPITVGGIADTGEPFAARFAMALDGTEIIASGTPDALRQVSTSPALTLTLEEYTPAEDINSIELTLSLENLAQESLREVGDPDRTKFSSSAASLSARFAADIEDDGSFSLSYASSDYSVAGAIALPPEADSDTEASDILANDAYGVRYETSTAAGFVSLAFDDSTLGGDVDFDGASGTVDISLGAANQSFSLEKGAVTARSVTDGVDFALRTDQVPVPVDINLGGAALSFTSPLSPRDEESDVQIGLEIRELAVDDFLWNLFDPGEVLPRDPASIIIDLVGQGRWLTDIFDETALATLGPDDLPGILSSAKIEALEISALGAGVEGEGSVSFDYTDLETFDGLPAPDGALSATISGVSGLIDNLVMLGLLPEEQALGARFMLGVFTTPVPDADDTVTTELSVLPDGQVFANGQRIR
ncbi:MAG: hypothetical protein AAFR50_08225 [Pseudomonadota bacterium]